MTQSHQTNRQYLSLSLKWKALVLLSMVLLLIFTSFYLIQYQSLKNNFEQDREADLDRNQEAISGLLTQSSNRLLQLGEIIPSLYGLADPLAQADAEGINKAFMDHWPALQLDLNIDTVVFFSRENTALSSWGNIGFLKEGENQAGDNMLLDRVREVNKSERPTTLLYCRYMCRHYAIVPILAKSTNAGAVLLASSLTDIVVNFRQVANTDIGMISLNTKILENKQLTDRYLPGWEANIVALTQVGTMQDLLQHVAEQYSLQQVATSGAILPHDGQEYEIRLLALNELTENAEGYFVIIHDITDALKGIALAQRKIVLVGVVGLVISEGVLLLVLWTPLSRLRQTAQALPLLAQGQFDAARTVFREKTRKSKITDEIDHLDSIATALSYQLEKLEQDVEQRTNALAEKMTELTHERDFVRGLLDTAQVIIVTQDRSGKILLFNNYGEQLTGYSNSELLGTSFTKLLNSDVSPFDIDISLAEVLNGKRRTLHHEASIICKNGSRRTVTWLHSHLESTLDVAPVALSVGLDITDRKQAESRLTWLADHDHLTGLYNRRRFQQDFSHLLKTAIRYGRSGALLFLDLDYFKYINDTSGHQIGDAVIKTVADELLKTSRDSDIVARLGGDEFAIALPEIDADSACQVASKVNEHLGSLIVPIVKKKYKITASIGIVMYPQHGTMLDELLANADIAMYQAKERGRGGWHVFSKEEQARERIEHHVYWKQQIEQALVQDRFILYYQPITDVLTGDIMHYEVLVRMLDEHGELLLPSSFIEIAEKTGQIHALDHWVLRHAILHLDRLNNQGYHTNFAINLSAHVFNDPRLLPLLEELLSTTRIKADRLIFEITETAALADFPAACQLTETIRNMGCKFALDDFGVGFCSFYYLKELPVDYIKIDGSFIRELAHNKDDQLIVKSMSEMARGFGRKTIAEFVEDMETLDLLREYHVDMAQGFCIGKPREHIGRVALSEVH